MKLSETVDKLVLFVAFIRNGRLTNVIFDSTKALVPAQLIGEGEIAFAYGLPGVLTVPIPDLEVSEEGIRATLSFNRLPFQTFVPWVAVRAVFDSKGLGQSWVEDEDEDASKRPAENVIPLFRK